MSQAKDSVRFTGTFIRASDAERGCVLFRTSRSMPDFARSSFYTTLQCERAHVPTGCSACPTKFANYNAVLPNVRLCNAGPRHITKSQRDFASKPKVVSNELPWVNFATRPNSNGVAAFTNTHRTTLTGNPKSTNNLCHNPYPPFTSMSPTPPTSDFDLRDFDLRRRNTHRINPPINIMK